MCTFLIKDNSILINFVSLGEMSERLIFNVSLETWSGRCFVGDIINQPTLLLITSNILEERGECGAALPVFPCAGFKEYF